MMFTFPCRCFTMLGHGRVVVTRPKEGCLDEGAERSCEMGGSGRAERPGHCHVPDALRLRGASEPRGFGHLPHHEPRARPAGTDAPLGGEPGGRLRGDPRTRPPSDRSRDARRGLPGPAQVVEGAVALPEAPSAPRRVAHRGRTPWPPRPRRARRHPGPGRRRWPPTGSSRCRGCWGCRHGRRSARSRSIPSNSTSATWSGGVIPVAGLHPGEVAALDQHPRRAELVDPAGHVGHRLHVLVTRWGSDRPAGPPPTGSEWRRGRRGSRCRR